MQLISIYALRSYAAAAQSVQAQKTWCIPTRDSKVEERITYVLEVRWLAKVCQVNEAGGVTAGSRGKQKQQHGEVANDRGVVAVAKVQC